MTDPAAPSTPPTRPPSTTPVAVLLRALPRLAFVAVLVGLAVTQSGWMQIFAVILLLFVALGAGDWARWVRTGVQPVRPGAAPAKIPDRFRGGPLEVWLEDAGPTRIQTIKLVRELTGLGLKEAKDLVDALPARLVGGLTEDGAAWVSRPFTTHGARTSHRPAGADGPVAEQAAEPAAGPTDVPDGTP